MLPFYQLAAVDARRATETGNSRAQSISKLTMPGLILMGSEHTGGGSVMTVKFNQTRIEALEPKFGSKGLDPDVFRGFGVSDRWVFAGSYREIRPGGGGKVAARAIIEGAVSAWEPDESDPNEFQECNHTFSEVTHYELTLGDKELFYVDFFENVLRINGVDLFADDRRALGI